MIARKGPSHRVKVLLIDLGKVTRFNCCPNYERSVPLKRTHPDDLYELLAFK